MSQKNIWFRPFIAFISLFIAIGVLTLNLGAYQLPNKTQQSGVANFSSLLLPAGLQTQPDRMSGLPSGNVIETFPNSWHGSTIGLVYNPVVETIRYAHEDYATDPNTIWDIGYESPHPALLGINLAAINAGWPDSLNNRDGAEYDPVANTYFLPDYEGDLANRDDNLIEIDPAGNILNAWELDGAGNDSSDGSAINPVIDIAIVPGASPRYFMTAAEGLDTVYEVSFIRAGLFITSTWSTVSTCTIPDMGDNVGIDYDEEYGVLYHSSFSNETIVVTDMACNVLTRFTCDGPGPAHTGITRVEYSDPQEVWVTDFYSNSTTRCTVPGLTLTKVAAVEEECTTATNEVYPGDQVRYCYEVTNATDPSYTQVLTFTTHSLQDDHLGTILSNTPHLLAPGATFSVNTTAVLTQTTTNLATWTASNGSATRTASATANVTVLNSPPALCNTYNSTDVPLAIPDTGVVTSTLTVPDTFSLFDVNVVLDITHTWDSDLVITLIGPLGDQIPLVTNRGGSGDNFQGTILDDQSATPVAAGVAPFTGRFHPEGSLDVLNGQNSSGTWQLRIADTAAADVGTLWGWSVELCEPPVGGIVLTQTVGTTPGVCAPTNVITVTGGTNIYYCYDITNTGNYTVAFHTLTDSELGTVLDDVYYSLKPGESVNTVDLGMNISLNARETITHTSNWYADIPGFVAAQDGSSAVVNVSGWNLYLPVMLQPAPCGGHFETEDNDSFGQADGPLPNNIDFCGYPDDQNDWFYLDMPVNGTLTLDLNNHTGQSVQIQLFYQVADAAHRVGFDSTPPYHIDCPSTEYPTCGAAGRYYVYIFALPPYNSDIYYTLRVTYP